MAFLDLASLTREFDDTLDILVSGEPEVTDLGVAELIGRLFLAGLDEAGHKLLDHARDAFPGSVWLNEDPEVLP